MCSLFFDFTSVSIRTFRCKRRDIFFETTRMVASTVAITFKSTTMENHEQKDYVMVDTGRQLSGSVDEFDHENNNVDGVFFGGGGGGGDGNQPNRYFFQWLECPPTCRSWMVFGTGLFLAFFFLMPNIMLSDSGTPASVRAAYFGLAACYLLFGGAIFALLTGRGGWYALVPGLICQVLALFVVPHIG